MTPIDLIQAFGIEITWDEGAELGQIGIPLEPGEYFVMAVVESADFGRIVTPAHPDPIEVCFPLPASGDDGGAELR